MKTLVTGGAGFVGSHITDKLIETGHEVVVLDNLSTGKKENINKEAKFYLADICQSDIGEIFSKEKPDAVLHLAAQIDVRKSIEDPGNDAKINILGALNILENCKKNKVKNFIFASSVGVYGDQKELPVTEKHFARPISPYPLAKLTVENYLNYYQAQGVRATALRYANIYGPRQESNGEGGVVAIFINTVLNNQTPVIFGDGNQTRDFLYVEDAAEAALKALERNDNLVCNIGTNEIITINQLLALINQELKKGVQPEFQQERFGEIMHSRVDWSLAKEKLGWQPQHSFSQGLGKTISWFLNKR